MLARKLLSHKEKRGNKNNKDTRKPYKKSHPPTPKDFFNYFGRSCDVRKLTKIEIVFSKEKYEYIYIREMFQ